MQNVKDYVAKVKQTNGFGYWNGTFGQVATESLWNDNYKRLPSWYSQHPDAKARWIGKRVVDCAGLDKYSRWVQPDGNVKYDSSTDYNEQMLFDKAKADGRKWGTIDTLPDTAGMILWKSGHMGIYVGYGIERESRGGDYGVQEYKVTDRNFTHWFENPFINYSIGGNDMLFKGCPISEAVGAWQRAILKCGYKMINAKGVECTVDNEFGGGTENGTKLFQKDEGLEQTGKVNEFDYGKMLDRLIAHNDKESAELCANFMEKSNALIAANASIATLTEENARLEKEVADQEAKYFYAMNDIDVLNQDKTELAKDKAALSDDKTKLMKQIDDLNYRITTEKTIADKKYNELLEKYGAVSNTIPADVTSLSFAELFSELIKRIAAAFKKKHTA